MAKHNWDDVQKIIDLETQIKELIGIIRDKDKELAAEEIDYRRLLNACNKKFETVGKYKICKEDIAYAYAEEDNLYAYKVIIGFEGSAGGHTLEIYPAPRSLYTFVKSLPLDK